MDYDRGNRCDRMSNCDTNNYSDHYKITGSLDGTTFTEFQTLEHQTGGPKTIPFANGVECRFLRIEMVSIVGGGDYGDEGFGVGIWEFTAKGKTLSGEENLVLNRRVKMLNDDGTEIPAAWGNVAANAVDGNGATVAQAASNNWNLFVDLGAEARVSSFEINNFWASYITECEIKTSLDGVEWQVAASEVKPPENQNFVVKLPNQLYCRYVLLDVKSFSSNEGCIADFTVNGRVTKEEGNISLNKTAFMTENGQDVTFWGGPEKALDGDNATYAQSNVNVPWDLTIDLENVFDITSLELQVNQDNYAKDYEIQISNDNLQWTTVLSKKDGTNAPVVYDFDRVYTARYIKIDVQEIVGGGADWGHAISEVTVMGNPALSISQGKKVKAISIENDNIDIPYWGTPEGAVDGDETTFLQSQTNIPWDMMIDLEGFYDIHTLRYLADENNYASDFEIEISNNGFSWTSIQSEKGNQEYSKIYTYSEPVKARYIRFNVTKVVGGGDTWGHSVKEWNVYGTAATEVPSDEVTNIELSKERVNLLQGESTKINAVLTPSDTSATIAWSSDNAQVATVDEFGNITATGAGTTKVWAKAGDIQKYVEVNVVGNIALNKPVTMSIAHGWENVAQNAVDGNFNTVAQGNQNINWELTVDLETFYNIKAIHVAMDDYNYASKFKIMGSTNGAGWLEIVAENDFVPKQVNKYTFEEQFVRYVKFVPLEVVGGGDNFGYAIQELEILGAVASEEGNNVVDDIELNVTEIELTPNESQTVAANIFPINSTAKVFWKSSDENIAKVDGVGNITGVSGGVCDVTVTALDKEATVRVYVKNDLAKGKTATMSIPAGFGNVANFAIDGNHGTVAQGAKDEPWDLTVDLGWKYDVNLIKICPDFYNYAKVFDLLVSEDGETYTKVISETEMKGEPKAYSFPTVSARYIKMDVHETYVTGTDCGHAIIDFEVYGPLVKVQSAGLEESSIKLGINETYTIPLKVLPENATIKTAKYYSSNENVVTVDANGNITGVAQGTAIITVVTYDGNIQNQLEVDVFESVNIAYGKAVKTSVPTAFGNIAAYAVDGNLDTYAQGGQNVNWTLQVDLGMNVKISRVNVVQDFFNFASKFVIKVSQDGENWKTVAECSRVLQNGTSVRFDPIEARYVLFEPLQTEGGGAGYGYAIKEFEIFNAYGVDLDQLELPVITQSGPKISDLAQQPEEKLELNSNDYLLNKLKAVSGQIGEFRYPKLNVILLFAVILLALANLGFFVFRLISKSAKGKNRK